MYFAYVDSVCLSVCLSVSLPLSPLLSLSLSFPLSITVSLAHSLPLLCLDCSFYHLIGVMHKPSSFPLLFWNVVPCVISQREQPALSRFTLVLKAMKSCSMSPLSSLSQEKTVNR